MNVPLVSVVMAAKNYGRFLRQAIDSVIVQTEPNWELIVVDDGSTDDTAAVLKRLPPDRRIRVMPSDRLGQPRAKNLGLRFARGEFIAFLDADDAWEPTKLEKQLAVFAADDRVGVVSCDRLLMDERGATRPVSPESATSGVRGDVLERIFLKNSICFSSAIVRRHSFERAGGFDPELDLAIDYDLWLRVAAHDRFEHIDEPLVHYRTGHANLSSRLADRVETALSIMQRHSAGGRISGAMIGEGVGTTCNSLAYVLRSSEPVRAVRWYLRALAWGGRRKETLKGLAVALLNAIAGRRKVGTPENAAVNA